MSLIYDRVRAARVARLATVGADGRPHIVPCCFSFVGDTIVSAVDAKPKSTMALRRLANIEANPAVSLVVDHYDDDWEELWWVRVDGEARVCGDGARRESALDSLATKYQQYRLDRPMGPVIEIEPTAWRAWP
jgi:PPOX class probable F420-dependent enzyme